MRRYIAILLTFALCFQSLGFMALTVKASSTEPQICEEMWEDDFSTNTISSYMNAGPDTGAWGSWSVTDGKLQVTGNTGANWWGTSLLLKDKRYENFVLEFDAEVSAGYGVILRAQDDATTAGSGLNAWHSGDAYVIMHWAPVENNASVQILDYNGTPNGEVLANAGGVGAMTSAHWKIMAIGNDITVCITDNNNISNQITYSLTNTRYSSGLIGFYNLTKDGITTFKADNLSITPINSMLYEDDYSDATLDDYFVAGPDSGAWGNWQAVNGKLQVTGNTGANWWGTSILTNSDYENFVMEFDADVSAGYGIFLRAQDDALVPGSGLNAWHSGNVYTIMHLRPVENDASIQILDYNGTSGGKLLADVGNIGAMTSAHWKIVAWGNSISIKVTDNNNTSNTLSYVLTDSTYTGGHIGFYNLTKAGVTSFKCDNLKIKGYTVPEIEPSYPTYVASTESWEDDFSENTGSNYLVAGPNNGAWGTWNVTDGKLQVTGNVGANWYETMALLKDVAYDDFIMEFDADVSAGYGVVLRTQDNASTPNVGLNKNESGNAYVIFHDRPVENDASLKIYNRDGDMELLANAGVVGAMTAAHWRIDAVGNDIIITITDKNNENNFITYTLHDSKYEIGMLGFYNLTMNTLTTLYVDNLQVTPLNNVLFEDDFSSGGLSDYFTAGPNNGIWGDWTKTSGKLQVVGNTEANWYGTSILTEEKYQDFVMEFDADVSAGYGVFLKAQDNAETKDSGLNTWYGGNAYVIMHWAPVENNASVQILDFNGTNGGEILANVGNIGAMTSAHWKIISLNGKIFIRVTDNANSKNTISYMLEDDTYEAGHVGFYNLTKEGISTLKLDNFIIKGITEQSKDETPDDDIKPDDSQQITEPKTEISWSDDMSQDKGNEYLSYGLWWNNVVSNITNTDYTGVLGNEGGSSKGFAYYYLQNYQFNDLVMEFDVFSTSSDAQYGVVLRAGNPGPGADQADGYTIMYDGNWVFAGKLDGTFTQIKSDTSAYAYNPKDNGITLSHWKVVCVGDTIAVYFNHSETPAIVIKDSTYTSGVVGFRALASANTVKNVIIDNLTVRGTGSYKETEEEETTQQITEPKTEISWSDDMSQNKGDEYLSYGLWWNNAVSDRTNTDYKGVLGNEGGSSTGYVYYYLKNYQFNDLVMEFDVDTTTADATYGVVLRAGNPGPGVDQADGYTIMYDGNWVFVAKLDGTFTQIKSDTSAYAYNPKDNGIELTHWKVVCVGDTIAVYFNNSEEPAIVVKDSTYKSGVVGFRALAPANTVKNVVIDNFKVRGTGTYKKMIREESKLIPTTNLNTYDFEWKDMFDTETYTDYLAYGRWWNNATSEFNGVDYSDILGNEGGIADGVCYYYLRKYKWVDFTMEFDVISADKTAQYGVVLRAAQYSAGADDCGGYTVMYDGDWIFVGKMNGKFNQIKSSDTPYAYNPSEHGIVPKHWKVVCIGDTIQVYLNGADEPVITVKDSEFTCGYAGLRTFAKEGQHTNVAFDNLHIKGSVLVEELTTAINSNRRKGNVSDYSTLEKAETKANKDIKPSLNQDVMEEKKPLTKWYVPVTITLVLGMIITGTIFISRRKKKY